MKKVLITGADGFIGKNLRVALQEDNTIEVLSAVRATETSKLKSLISESDAIVHLAGVNRPMCENEFATGNAEVTAKLCELLRGFKKSTPVVFASSIQAKLDNAYGRSKREAEAHLADYAETTGATVGIYRLPNVFGKWCRPNYNSAVATFCYNVARGLPIRVDDPKVELNLVYVDDVVMAFKGFLGDPPSGLTYPAVEPVYSITVGRLISHIQGFDETRDRLVAERVGKGLLRALYSTYVSYLPPNAFSYVIPQYADSRGIFVEFLKTLDSGQFSVLTANPGVTRGGHYHHTKVEKFLVIKGQARFRFRNVVTNEEYELTTDGEKSVVVESIPGWAHDIKNIGESELVAVVWANEIFDRDRPDTVASMV